MNVQRPLATGEAVIRSKLTITVLTFLVTAVTATAAHAPSLKKIRDYRAATIELRERKCLKPHTIHVAAHKIPVQWRAAIAERWRHKMIDSMYAGSHCNDVDYVISLIFGPYAREAMVVAECESRLYRYARNGQYLGLFQMGSSERARYGHGDTAYAQTLAAWRYFVASGKDWSPWQCRPSGGLGW